MAIETDRSPAPEYLETALTATSVEPAASESEPPLVNIDPAALTATSGNCRLDGGLQPRPARRGLPRLALTNRDDMLAEYELGGVIGEGGMGLVHSAVQLSIGREVAVKSVHPNQRGNRQICNDLLAEAQISGSLEHPNIVPIYSVGCDEAGLPLIVMKRIDGAVWSEVLRDPNHPALEGVGEDPLVWHLGILSQVCQAVQFAHSRGVVHRDLKPANVMIGAFGEVYVLDWGLALRIASTPPPDAPQTLSGTPVYMAPEMVDASRGPITPQTDVFLLGAMLYELLFGKPPWASATVNEALVKARICSPIFDTKAAPPQLVAIARQALAEDPKDRFETPELFRLAIEAFIRHRGAASLAAHAQARLDEMRKLLASGSLLTSSDEARIHGLFGECRFGFAQALAAWPEGDAARVGRFEAYLLIIDFELRGKRPGAAAALLNELDEPPADLRDRVEKLRLALALDAQRLEQLEREVDVNVHIELRRRLFLIGSLSTALLNAAAEVLARLEIYRMEYLVYGSFNVFALVALGLVWSRLGQTEFRTTFNRVYAMSFSATCAATMLLWVGLGCAGTPFMWALVLANVPQIVGAATVAFGIDPRMRWLPVVYLVTGIIGLIWPEQVYIWATLASLVGIFVLIVAWRQPRPEVVRSVDVHPHPSHPGPI